MVSLVRPSLLPVFFLLFFSAALRAQSYEGQPNLVWSTPRSWSVFTEYSPDSSHILLGITREREFITVGGSFSQRLYQGRFWEFYWAPEIRPFMGESDPVTVGNRYDICSPTADPGQPCTALIGSTKLPHEIPVMSTSFRGIDYSSTLEGQNYFEDYNPIYGRRWTYVSGLSPVDFRATFRPRARLQPVAGVTGGFAVSPRDIPMFDTSAFNFTFSLDAGIQLWRDRTHATLIEYRIQHLSNADIGYGNPGIDSQMLHVSYMWGVR